MVETAEKTALQVLKERGLVMDRQGKDFVLYAGLLDLVHDLEIASLVVSPVQLPDNDNGQTAIMAATLTLKDGRVFTDVGDANPQNTGKLIAPHLIRMASTRAKARVMRDALNIGVAALEELGDNDGDVPAAQPQPTRVPQRIVDDFDVPDDDGFGAGPPVRQFNRGQSGGDRPRLGANASSEPPSPKQLGILDKNGVPEDDPSRQSKAAASEKIDQIFSEQRASGGGRSFR